MCSSKEFCKCSLTMTKQQVKKTGVKIPKMSAHRTIGETYHIYLDADVIEVNACCANDAKNTALIRKYL